MMRVYLRLIQLALAPLLLVLMTTSVRADWIEDSNRYALEILKQQAQLSPEGVSNYGLSEFDAEVADLGPNITQREIALAQQQLSRLRAALESESAARVRQDLQIMIDALESEITTAQLEYEHLLPYYDMHGFMFGSFKSLLDPRNDAARYPAALERLRKYTGQSEGYQPATEQAMALTEARLKVDGLIGPYRGQLEADLDNAPRYIAGIRSVFESSGLTAWESDFAVLEEQLNQYEAWLRATLEPRARDNNTLPEVLYANELQNFGVTDSPAELIAEAQYSYQLIRSQMKALARQIAEKRGWKERDLLSVLHQLKAEQVPQEDLLALYKQRLTVIEDIVRKEDLVSLPERDAVIRLATEAESAAIPASFMSPPQLINNTGQYGEFVLVQSNPALGDDAQMDDWSHDSIVWALTVHEARPGHELQFSRLVEDGTSLARAVFAFNSANAEGWGLYSESIMQQYLPLEGQLFNLYTRLMRAARMFLDPMVNTGQMSRQEAEDFLVEQTAMSRAMASSEADRYAFRAPGQATSYYFGYIRLMRLRTEVEIALGDQFEPRAFHDFILQQGLLPPNLLREAVLAEFVQSAE
ncbi:DUF885 domain-containing protein [Parahaliea sp. F7430]|uniref:DUF885 domain-containing protein n=1 Tax=Sediminihaliea albiluteola TaxID=2758564 RepID=A0A7W2TU79_9GAMM|nr:DUF885 domain-containing protein [Sediminihaliea albiluteola]MBA6412062.1 DUF885 domain-containing protein [Sediminihaliea albiluteola]